MRTWFYLTNPFDSATKANYEAGYTISNYHNAQLLAHKENPFFGEMFAIYNPLHKALSDAYTAWKEQGNERTAIH